MENLKDNAFNIFSTCLVLYNKNITPYTFIVNFSYL